MDFEILKIRNVLAIVAAAGLEFGLSELNGVKAFNDTESYQSFLLFLVVFILLFWVIERLYKWLARR
ncbi:MAG: hypothetical protein AAFW46_18795 [Pseudomonadota bacterium]